MSKVMVDVVFHLLTSKKENVSPEYIEYRRKWNENPKNFIVGDFPIHIDIENNTTCNLKCFMCFQAYSKPDPVMIDMKDFRQCIDEGVAKGLCSIKMQYRGEPLLDPLLEEKVKYAKDHGILEVMMNSNATLLTEARSRKLIKAGLDKIICSVDGCTKEVYESVRIGASFEKVLQNIKRLQEIKKEVGSQKPIVRVQMVETPRNYFQKEEYLNFWQKIADQVATEDMLDWSGSSDDATPLPEFACQQLWQRLVVLADGDVVPCCRAVKAGREKLGVVGNIHKDSLENIWKGKLLETYRTLHKNGESHKIPMCTACDHRKRMITKGEPLVCGVKTN
ncbi:MAG: SPASM domain-containing protein [Candidatus Omnitrophica bacterium]|nr:SPASM domain-containing protein [Candidatus Omnitrophota bacterium]